MLSYTSVIKERAIEPYVNAEYDYKFVDLINKSVEEKLSKNDFVEKIVFALVTDINLNGKRVTAVLLSNVSEANMTLYNPSILISGGFEKGGIVVDESLAKELGLHIGDKVIVSPVYANHSLDLRVTGIARSPIPTVKVIMEYPKIFKEYFRSRLPNNATYGEAYIKFKNGDKRYFASRITNEKEIVLKSDKIKKLSEYYESEFNSLPALIYIYSGFGLFVILFIRESLTYTKRNYKVYRKLKEFGFSSRIIMWHLAYFSNIMLLSTALAITYWVIFSKLFLGVLEFDSLSPLLILIPSLLFVSVLVSYEVV